MRGSNYQVREAPIHHRPQAQTTPKNLKSVSRGSPPPKGPRPNTPQQLKKRFPKIKKVIVLFFFGPPTTKTRGLPREGGTEPQGEGGLSPFFWVFSPGFSVFFPGGFPFFFFLSFFSMYVYKLVYIFFVSPFFFIFFKCGYKLFYVLYNMYPKFVYVFFF